MSRDLKDENEPDLCLSGEGVSGRETSKGKDLKKGMWQSKGPGKTAPCLEDNEGKRYLPLPHAAFLIEGIGPQGRLISISQSVTGSGMSI